MRRMKAIQPEDLASPPRQLKRRRAAHCAQPRNDHVVGFRHCCHRFQQFRPIGNEKRRAAIDNPVKGALPTSMTSLAIPRRRFLKDSSSLALAATIAPFTQAAESLTKERYPAVIIGHTGRGNYGHDMDLIFTDHPKIEV